MAFNQSTITLLREINWLQQVIDQVIRTYLLQDEFDSPWCEIPVPVLDSEEPYAKMVEEWDLSIYERLAIALAMAPHLKPESLDIFFGRNQLYDRGFTEFGGVIDKSFSGFIPTGQTYCFIIAYTEEELRSKVMKVLGENSILMKEGILTLGDTNEFIPNLNGVLSISDSWMEYFLTGEKPKIEQSATFPAKQITTKMNWEDVVLSDNVLDKLEEISAWLDHGPTIMEDWGLNKMIKPGYRALFYGPPGTGKTLTATLLGKHSQREVYRVDLSMIVSKYIGETEKNLARIFDIAQYKDWILFFDEADALFGKRTAANSSNDRHANQQTSFLLQRIEDYPGVIILASNLKANMDEAFTRRFQAMIHFSMPSTEERYRLWQSAFSIGCRLDESIDLYQIAENYEIAGGSIINVLRYCALKAVQREDKTILMSDLETGIRVEFAKENRTVSQSI
ncbi:MAG: ATP-binding protein [Crocinitomicaceae bacterium]